MNATVGLTDQNQEVLSKAAFAARSNVTPARVSQWIGDGMIDGDALIGEGRNAEILVDEAQAQLRERLDISQQLGNGATTDLGGGSSNGNGEAGATIDQRLRQQKLMQAEAATRKALADEMSRAGMFILAADHKAEVSKIAGVLLSMFESSLTDMANIISADFDIPKRDVIHSLRQQFRKFRQSAANRLGTKADSMTKNISMPMDGSA